MADPRVQTIRNQLYNRDAWAAWEALDSLARDVSRVAELEASVERKMARLRQADEVIDGYERDIEDLKAKLHEKHDRVAELETALRDVDATLEQALTEIKPGTKAWREMTFADREDVWADFVAAARKQRRKIAALAGSGTDALAGSVADTQEQQP